MYDKQINNKTGAMQQRRISDQEHCYEAPSYLNAVSRFGLELCVEIKIRHTSVVLPGAVYDKKKSVCRIVVKS